MTMETYRWQREHRTTPTATVQINRTLPEGKFTIQSEDWTIPPNVETSHEKLEDAMRAADAAVKKDLPHECGPQQCGEWTPVPPHPRSA